MKRTIGPRLRLAFFGFVCLALLLAGAAWRLPTLQTGNYLRFTAGHLSYSDVVAFYSVKRVAAHALPYARTQIEYPVLIGLVLWLAGYAPRIEGYFLVNAALLVSCLLVCFLLLARTRPRARLALFACAPALAFYGVLNWDALALVWLVAAICLARGGRFGWAGASLGLGAAAKLFPALGLPVLLAEALRGPAVEAGGAPQPWSWRRLTQPRALRLVAGFALATVLLNLPVALLSVRGWIYPYLAQAGRGVNPDSVWAGLPALPNLAVSAIFALLVLAGTAWVSWKVYETGRWEAGVLLAILVFCLFAKDYSPQYDLWLVPLLALLGCPVWLWLLFVVADAAYYAAIFFFYFIYVGGHLPLLGTMTDLLVRASVWGRELMLALLFAWGLAALYGMTAPEGWQWLTRALDARTADYLAKYPTPAGDTDR